MNIALVGYGKMGKIIEKIAIERGHNISLIVSKNNAGSLSDKGKIAAVDVAIEFSVPESGFDNVMSCIESGVNVISGTTGWNDRLAQAEELANQKGVGFLYASNFSLGVNLFFNLNEHLALLMNDHQGYDVELKEIHHTSKKDAPSGTGITLANHIIDHIDRKETWVNHKSDKNTELSLLSERIDPAPGTHMIKYTSDIDEIEIIHTAKSREGFALGAVIAAEFVAGKKGVFSMKDVLGLS